MYTHSSNIVSVAVDQQNGEGSEDLSYQIGESQSSDKDKEHRPVSF